MTTISASDRIRSIGLLPVVSVDDVDQAQRTADALVKGGLPVIEVCYRTAATTACIAALAKRGDLLVGAGTVINGRQVQEALDAGASFLVSPGSTPTVAAAVQKSGLPWFPGACTPSEVMAALDAGAPAVKFFPADAYGGLTTLNALSGPFPGVKFVPTGGITAANLADYLRHKAVVACGGSWMVKPDLLRAGRFDEVERLTAAAMAVVAAARKPA